MNKPLVAVVVGPTASGKTGLAIEIAEHFGGEIVSADSMQIYEDMDIAVAKPSPDELSRVPHHLIGIVKSSEEFSVAKYKELATEAIDSILAKGKLPILAGGTGLYVDTLINNTEFLDYEKSDIRERLSERAKSEGIAVLFEELKAIDPESAEKLHISDEKRIIRALEVYYSTGYTITHQRELSHANESKYRFVVIGITAEDRQYLYDRINLRVDIMLREGLIAETEAFFAGDFSKTAKQAIGYKELKPWLDGECTFDDAVENLKMQTRRYAKRQLTWFRRNENIHWLKRDLLSDRELVSAAVKIIEENL